MPSAAAVADLDGDGRDELVWTDAAGGASVFGTAMSASLEAGPAAGGVAADLDGDGRDAVYALSGDGRVFEYALDDDGNLTRRRFDEIEGVAALPRVRAVAAAPHADLAGDVLTAVADGAAYHHGAASVGGSVALMKRSSLPAQPDYARATLGDFAGTGRPALAAGGSVASDFGSYPVARFQPAAAGVAAAFTASVRGNVVSFDAADSRGDALLYDWDFGNDVDGFGGRVTHEYDGAGEFIVRLTVVDSNNARHTIEQVIRTGGEQEFSAGARGEVRPEAPERPTRPAEPEAGGKEEEEGRANGRAGDAPAAGRAGDARRARGAGGGTRRRAAADGRGGGRRDRGGSAPAAGGRAAGDGGRGVRPGPGARWRS